jgi:hypothetical protein
LDLTCFKFKEGTDRERSILVKETNINGEEQTMESGQQVNTAYGKFDRGV